MFKVTSPFRTREVKATELPEAIEAALEDLEFVRGIDEGFKENKVLVERLEN